MTHQKYNAMRHGQKKYQLRVVWIVSIRSIHGLFAAHSCVDKESGIFQLAGC